MNLGERRENAENAGWIFFWIYYKLKSYFLIPRFCGINSTLMTTALYFKVKSDCCIAQAERKESFQDP